MAIQERRASTKTTKKKPWAIAAIVVLLLSGFFGIGAPFINNGNDLGTVGDESAGIVGSQSKDKAGAGEPSSDLEVIFLDVGQGDAALVSQNGHYMLIDGGNKKSSALIYTVLKDRGIKKLDYLINSHPDEDHLGGLPGALQIATVDKAFCSVVEHDTEAFRDFKDKLVSQGVAITVPKTGETFAFADSQLTFIQLEKDYGDVNDDSLVVRLTYKDTTYLFTGDIGTEAEKDLADSGIALEADVLKVPHHGSKYSSSYQFLRAINPAIAIISVGANNSYGHPTDEALSKYRDLGARLYRTDMQGDITIVSDGAEVRVTTKKTATGDVFTPNTKHDEANPYAVQNNWRSGG